MCRTRWAVTGTDGEEVAESAYRSAGERHEDRHARFRTDLARDVTLAGEVLGEEDVAGAEPSHGAVTNLDVHCARQREHCSSTGRMMPRVGSRCLEPADGDPAAGNQLGALGAVASRFEPRMDLLEVRLAVGSRVDANNGHVISDLDVSSGPREPPRLDRHPLPLAYSHCATSASVSPPNASREPSDSMVPVRITYT